MALTKEELAALAKEVGTQAAGEIKTQIDALDVNLNAKYEDFKKGTVSDKDFIAFKEESLKQINEALKKLGEIAEANKAQGDKITGLLEAAKPGERKTMEDVIRPLIPKMQELKAAGTGYIELTGTQLKEAGVTSIGGSITPETPYLPGLTGTALEMFDIIRAPD